MLKPVEFHPRVFQPGQKRPWLEGKEAMGFLRESLCIKFKQYSCSQKKNPILYSEFLEYLGG